MNEKTFKCYGCMSEKPLSEKSNYFVRVICIETKEISINPVCKFCREKFLKMDGEHDDEKCEHAEKHNGMCLGFQKSEWNDEPIEQCERCKFYEGLKDGEVGWMKLRCVDCEYYRETDIEHMIYRFCSLMDEGVNEGDSCWVCMEKGGEQDDP